MRNLPVLMILSGNAFLGVGNKIADKRIAYFFVLYNHASKLVI